MTYVPTPSKRNLLETARDHLYAVVPAKWLTANHIVINLEYEGLVKLVGSDGIQLRYQLTEKGRAALVEVSQ